MTDKIHKDVLGALLALTEHDRIPTILELERFIKWYGYPQSETKPVPPIPQEPKLSNKEFIKLPIEERREILLKQVETLTGTGYLNQEFLKILQEQEDYYRPLLEQAEQRVKELEEKVEFFKHENKNLDNEAEELTEYKNTLEAENARLKEELVTVTKQRDSNLEVLLEVKHRFDALESQLKPVSGWEDTILTSEQQKSIINKNVEMGGRHFYSAGERIAKAQAELTWRKARQGMVELDENQEPPPTYFDKRKKMPWISDYDVEKQAQQDMLKAGFRRVKLGKGGTK